MIRGRLRSAARLLDSFGPWLGFALLGVVFGLGVRSTNELVGNTAWVDHTHRVIESIDDVTLDVARASASRRDDSLTGDGADVGVYAAALRGLVAAEGRLRTLTADNARQQRRLDALEPVLAGRIARWNASLDDHHAQRFDRAREVAAIRTEARADADLASRTDELAAEEHRLLVVRERRMDASFVRTRWLEVVGACLGLLLIAVVVVRLRREVRRRERSESAVRESEQRITLINADLERRVEARTAQLEQTNAELEAFSYAVVHDLRAPLRAMGGFAEVLRAEHHDVLDLEADDCLREIVHNARRMAQLIDALVAMFRITRTTLQRSAVDLTDVARAGIARLDAAGSRPRPEVVVEEELGRDADPALVARLFEILLGNAWKFTGQTPSARIEVGETRIAGARVLFVRDNGAGFDMDHAAKLFAPFGRLHTVDEFPGLGVGLASAQRIVQRHGGRIWADGRVGRGATFYFTMGPTADGGTT